jgi:hypothetical protein
MKHTQQAGIAVTLSAFMWEPNLSQGTGCPDWGCRNFGSYIGTYGDSYLLEYDAV